MECFHPPVTWEAGIHETAIIGKNVSLGENVAIGPYVVINDNAVIGDNVIIRPYVYIGHNVRIGEGSDIYAGAVVHENCVLGKRVVLRAKAVVGGEGFGFATEAGKHIHIPQVGNVVLEDDVEVGSCSCIDNATMGSTLVRRGTKIDNLVHLGHNVEIGEDCFIIAQVGIAGSTKTGNHCILQGKQAALAISRLVIIVPLQVRRVLLAMCLLALPWLGIQCVHTRNGSRWQPMKIVCPI